MSDKVIREGGYQPEEDPPARPPAKLMKQAPAKPPERPVAERDDDAGGGEGD